MKLPSLQSKTHRHSLIYKNKIDVSQLDNEDKEKILRMVFQKMNSGIPPKPWRQYYDYALNDDNVQEREEENDMNDSQQKGRYDENQIQHEHDDSHLQNQQYSQFVEKYQ